LSQSLVNIGSVLSALVVLATFCPVWADGVQSAPVGPDAAVRYDPCHENYYAGYGCRLDLGRGYTELHTQAGLAYDVHLDDHRQLVCLQGSGYVQHLQLQTGDHVSFYAAQGEHGLRCDTAGGPSRPLTVTPSLVYNWTFTQPGVYSFVDTTGSAPIGTVVVNVSGASLAFDDTAFRDHPVTTRPEPVAFDALPDIHSDVGNMSLVGALIQEPEIHVAGEQPAQPVVMPQRKTKHRDETPRS